MAHSNLRAPERDEANAHLVAAAPELLALLEKLCDLNAKGAPIAKTWGAAEELLRRVRGIE